MPGKSEIRNLKSEMPAPSASGSILAASEAGLRHHVLRVRSALAAGARPLAEDIRDQRSTAVGGCATDTVEISGLVPPRGRTPALQVVRGVAVIDIVGPLYKEPDLYNWIFGTLTYPQLADQAEQARRDPRVMATLLRIDSPGGTVAGVSDLCDALLRLRSQKPVVAAVSDLCASGAYMAASCASRVTCDSDGWVGSIGVYLVVDDVSRMYQAAGWDVMVFRTDEDPLKGAAVPGTPISPEQAADYQRQVNDRGTEMIRQIYTGRPGLKAAGMKLPDGRVYIAAEAQRMGLIDAVAPWAVVLEAMQGGDYEAAKVGGGT